MTEARRDLVYRQPLSHVGDFRFDATVADVFADMIARSVPGYATVLAMIPALATRFVTAQSQVYDLGCSLGAASFAVAKSEAKNCQIIAVDNSPAMVDRFRSQLDALENRPNTKPSIQLRSDHPIQVRQSDIEETEICNASLVMLNYTLQFIAPENRDGVLDRIYAGMIDGGALLLSEKIHLQNDRCAALLRELHHDFKRAHGYSDLEISQKRTALEKTLITDTTETHIERIQQAGFRTIVPWFSCLGFVSILAIKD